MKYSNAITINRPISQVVALFDDPSNMKYWQPELVSYEIISGKQGQVGAKAKVVSKMGKQQIEMTETVMTRNLPQEFTVTYDTKGVWNSVRSMFMPVDENTTRLEVEQEFKFSGFMKIMGILMPGAFKKESVKYLEQFKAFVEKQ